MNNATTTPAKAMQAALEKTGLPFREITCFGSQIHVDCVSEETARKWVLLLGKIATVHKMVRVARYVGDSVNSGHPKTFPAWAIWATV